MVVETDLGNANEREASPKHFYLYKEKSDLEGFQRDFKTFFYKYLSHSHTCQKKAHARFKKEKKNNNNCTGLAN